MADRLVVALRFAEREAEIAENVRRLGVARQNLFEVRDRLFEARVLQKDRAEIVVRAGVARIECERLLIVRHRFVEPADGLKCGREIVVRLDIVRLERKRPADEIDAAVGLSLLELAEAEKMQRRVVTGLGLQQRIIRGLRFDQPAGLMRARRLRQQVFQLGRIRHRHSGP